LQKSRISWALYGWSGNFRFLALVAHYNRYKWQSIAPTLLSDKLSYGSDLQRIVTVGIFLIVTDLGGNNNFKELREF
jgi:hypothetical protein